MFLESKQIIATVQLNNLCMHKKMQNKTFVSAYVYNTSVYDARMTLADPNVASFPFCGGTINTEMLLPISFRILYSKAYHRTHMCNTVYAGDNMYEYTKQTFCLHTYTGTMVA